MLEKNQVVQIIDELKKSKCCYVSEAHIQLQFAIIGAQLFGNQFDFIPEFPGHTTYSTNTVQKTEFDLLVFDKKIMKKALLNSSTKQKTKETKVKEKNFLLFLAGGWN